MIGDKDQDGFYWGELRGRRGYVPHNMVQEVDETPVGLQGTNTSGTLGGAGRSAPANAVQQSARNMSRERWGDIYCNMPVKRMIALYDYDPQELSPNVDAEVCAIILYFIPYRFNDTNTVTQTNITTEKLTVAKRKQTQNDPIRWSKKQNNLI